jgi:membrane-bound lytic murein transglycosylase F
VRILYLFFAIILCVACNQKEDNDQATLTPWRIVDESDNDTMEHYSLEEILDSKELIVLTVTGENTYYTFEKAELGVQYLLCTQLAHHLGVGLRVEVCSDTLQLVQKIRHNEGDLIITPIKTTIGGSDSLTYCGPDVDGARWAVMNYNKELAEEVDKWYTPQLLEASWERQRSILASGAVKRHVYDVVLDKRQGVISKWDALFKKYAPLASIDWRLMAALCYQESCFDPMATSWAGACGLMQIMPTTAANIGLTVDKLYDPESNVAASAQLINQLITLFRDVPDESERLKFVLASYNGGPGHVRDAMSLAEKYGEDGYVWDVVADYILKLSQPAYYRDPVVKCGYMRGTETHDYVYSVKERYEEYTGVAMGEGSFGTSSSGEYNGVSTKPTRRESSENKYQI